METSAALTIVGLGPGDATLLTVEAREVLSAAAEVWLRTARHPTVAELPAGPRYESFDAVYDRGEDFAAVYAEIVERVLALAARPGGVVYAVPGHPLFGEATVRELLKRAADSGVSTRIVPGLSFLDVVASVAGVDPLADGGLLVDALSLGIPRRLLVPQRPTFIAQVYDRRAASQVKLALLDVYPPEHPVSIVRAGGTAAATTTQTTVAALDHDEAAFDHLTTLFVPPLPMAEDLRSFEGLRAIIAQLRSPDGGCPWDLEQTHETLKRFLLEEMYEALDALDEGEPRRMAEEMGDLLMQIVLHAQVAEDGGEFAIEDVIGSIAAKLVRRHPHVFGDVQVSGAGEVLQNWEQLKKDERGDQPILDAVPKAMPALAQAQSALGRALKAGLAELPDIDVALERLNAATLSRGSLGEVLFAIVGLARTHDIDAEESLRVAIRRFRDDVAQREKTARQSASS